MGDQDSVNAHGTFAAESFKAPHHFLAAQAGINEESGVLGFEQRSVARATRRENRYA